METSTDVLPPVDTPSLTDSLSVVLPAYNEEEVIERTVLNVCNVLQAWSADFEVVVVNDGSSDRTGEILARLAGENKHVHVVTHEVNQGYGAALVSGFAAASKTLTLFMDSDGQFDIRDLRLFFPYIDQYDAVLGYRIDRQDPWVRKLNALGWKTVVRLALGVHVRDIDCAFKLYKTDFIHQITLETRGAMINAEMLYKFRRMGYRWYEVGVHHLPRYGGKATGANPKVILRAFKELFAYAAQWRREERTGVR
jgi:glycosyltransferase involved in cell wall biosynthesis